MPEDLKKLELTEREKQLISQALYIMECQCRGKELHYEIEDELGGTPNPDEIRELMDKVEDEHKKA